MVTGYIRMRITDSMTTRDRAVQKYPRGKQAYVERKRRRWAIIIFRLGEVCKINSQTVGDDDIYIFIIARSVYIKVEFLHN